jgi:hypothetical protein
VHAQMYGVFFVRSPPPITRLAIIAARVSRSRCSNVNIAERVSRLHYRGTRFSFALSRHAFLVCIIAARVSRLHYRGTRFSSLYHILYGTVIRRWITTTDGPKGVQRVY